MSKIEELIEQHCPDGVEYRELGAIIISLKTGLNPRKFFILNTKDASNYYVTVRELGGIDITFYEKTDRIDDEALKLINNRSNLDIGDILFSGTGTVGRTAIIKTKPTNWNIKEGVYVIKPNQKTIISKYLLYYLNSEIAKKQIENKIVGSPVCSIPMAELRKITIPVPPLPIQQEIVNILDKFTQLQAELEAELEARRKQYEYYRNELLNFEGKEVEWKKLGEISKILRGTAITEKETISGEFPVVANGPNPNYYHEKSNRSGEIIVIARSGAYCGLVTYWNIPLFLTDAFSIHPDNTLFKTKFVYYLLKKEQEKIHQMKKGSGVPHVRAKDFESYSIPLSSLPEQDRIVAILDKFEALVNDKTYGLPAEIEARRKQYEYYRGKLLDFKRINNG